MVIFWLCYLKPAVFGQRTAASSNTCSETVNVQMITHHSLSSDLSVSLGTPTVRFAVGLSEFNYERVGFTWTRQCWADFRTARWFLRTSDQVPQVLNWFANGGAGRASERPTKIDSEQTAHRLLVSVEKLSRQSWLLPELEKLPVE